MDVRRVPDAVNRAENLTFSAVTNESSLVYDVRYGGDGNSRQLCDVFYPNGAHSRRNALHGTKDLKSCNEQLLSTSASTVTLRLNNYAPILQQISDKGPSVETQALSIQTSRQFGGRRNMP